MAEKQSRDDNGSPKYSREKVRFLPIREIKDFPDHPFQVKDDDSMQALMDSIESIGVQTPVIARKVGENQYELISGHRRKHACEKLGIDVIPIIVREMSRDDAIIEMVDAMPTKLARAGRQLAVSQEVIDSFLRLGGCTKNSASRIYTA